MLACAESTTGNSAKGNSEDISWLLNEMTEMVKNSVASIFTRGSSL